MNKDRYDHGSVSMGNKMFVIGGDMNLTCEEFDSVSRKFTYIKELSVGRFSDLDSVKAITVGSKIIVFAGIDSTYCEVDVYDPLKDQWYLQLYKFDDFIAVDSCSKLPIV